MFKNDRSKWLTCVSTRSHSRRPPVCLATSRLWAGIPSFHYGWNSSQMSSCLVPSAREDWRKYVSIVTDWHIASRATQLLHMQTAVNNSVFLLKIKWMYNKMKGNKYKKTYWLLWRLTTHLVGVSECFVHTQLTLRCL